MSSDGGNVSAVLVNQRSEVGRLAHLAEQFADMHGLSADDRFAINLVLDEVVINIINYGYDDEREHQIHLTLSMSGEIMTIEVADDARPFDLLGVPSPNLDAPIEDRPIGGLGVYLVRSMMDTVQHRREGNRNVLTMTKKVRRASY